MASDEKGDATLSPFSLSGTYEGDWLEANDLHGFVANLGSG